MTKIRRVSLMEVITGRCMEEAYLSKPICLYIEYMCIRLCKFYLKTVKKYHCLISSLQVYFWQLCKLPIFKIIFIYFILEFMNIQNIMKVSFLIIGEMIYIHGKRENQTVLRTVRLELERSVCTHLIIYNCVCVCV